MGWCDDDEEINDWNCGNINISGNINDRSKKCLRSRKEETGRSFHSEVVHGLPKDYRGWL